MAHRAIWTRRTGYSLMLQQNGVYYFRKAVPEPLRPILGKREVLTSLKTKDRETAKRQRRNGCSRSRGRSTRSLARHLGYSRSSGSARLSR